MDVAVDAKSVLITDGPFLRIRHPIYAYQALLMVCSAVVLPTPPMIALAVDPPRARERQGAQRGAASARDARRSLRTLRRADGALRAALRRRRNLSARAIAAAALRQRSGSPPSPSAAADAHDGRRGSRLQRSIATGCRARTSTTVLARTQAPRIIAISGSVRPRRPWIPSRDSWSRWDTRPTASGIPRRRLVVFERDGEQRRWPECSRGTTSATA